MNPYWSIWIGPEVLIPAVTGRVSAGFPSPAEDHEEEGLDLSRRFVRNPLATFLVQANGESLIEAGIHSGDFLLVDRSREPQSGDVVIAIVDGDFTAKYFQIHGGRVFLEPANALFAATPWREGCEIWGVVTSLHRDFTRRSTT